MLDYCSPYDEHPMREQTVSSVLANRAEHLGSEPYLFYGPEDSEYSFAETNEIANIIGNSLRDVGVEKQYYVSLMMHNSLETMFAMFGINKAGAVYSPINYDYEGSVLAYQLNDTAPELLIIEDQYVERLNAIVGDLESIPTIAVSETEHGGVEPDEAFDVVSYDAFRKGDSSPPDVETEWYDTASLVYTSGTTGRPKGVVLPHRWIFGNYIYPSVPNEDAVSHCPLPLYHVGGLYASNVSALASGSAVALWDRYSPNDFWDRVEKYGATSSVLISVMMTWLMDQPEREDDRRNPITYVSMNPLPDNYDEIAKRFGFDFVGAGFGQTESGNPTGSLIHAAKGEYATPEDVRKIPVKRTLERAEIAGRPVVDEAPDSRYMGRPTEGIDVAILDDNDEEVPHGEVGELAIRSKDAGLLMKKYYGKPERTVEAFRNLWFHTGDAAYRDEDGNFYFVDRMGDVIRRRGENISSMQIQEAALEHEAVSQAAAFPVPAPAGGEDEIGLVYEFSEGHALSEREMREALEAGLPDFMVPKHVVRFDEIPTTETNKMEKYKIREQVVDQKL